MDNQVLGYKDLAAIPKDKAILDIERPDLMIYEPHFTYSLLEHVELPRSREVRGEWVESPWALPLVYLLAQCVSPTPPAPSDPASHSQEPRNTSPAPSHSAH